MKAKQNESDLSGEVIVATFGGTYDLVFEEYIKKPFEELHQNVNVSMAPYVNLTRLQNQGGGNGVDVVSLDDFDLISAANSELLMPLEEDDFEHWDDLYPEAFLEGEDGNVYGLTNVFGSWGTAYDTEKMDKPESWNDFFDPEVQNHIALMEQWIPDILMLARAKDTSTENLEPVWDAYKKLSPVVTQFYSSFSAPESLFQTGEVWMASWFDGRAYSMREQGAPIDFVIPEET